MTKTSHTSAADDRVEAPKIDPPCGVFIARTADRGKAGADGVREQSGEACRYPEECRDGTARSRVRCPASTERFHRPCP